MLLESYLCQIVVGNHRIGIGICTHMNVVVEQMAIRNITHQQLHQDINLMNLQYITFPTHKIPWIECHGKKWNPEHEAPSEGRTNCWNTPTEYTPQDLVPSFPSIK